MPRFCTSCGTELIENARFCRLCGAAVRQTQPSQPAATQQHSSSSPEPFPSAPQYVPSALSSPAPNSYLQKLEQWLQVNLVEKAPPLPNHIAATVLKVAPWVMVVLLVIAASQFFGYLGGGAFWLRGDDGAGAMRWLIYMLFALALAAFRALSLPGLFNRTATGWRLAYYAMLVGALSSILHFNLPALVLNGAFLYVLFQVRNYYR